MLFRSLAKGGGELAVLVGEGLIEGGVCCGEAQVFRRMLDQIGDAPLEVFGCDLAGVDFLSSLTQ